VNPIITKKSGLKDIPQRLMAKRKSEKDKSWVVLNLRKILIESRQQIKPKVAEAENKSDPIVSEI